jgi:hypothetical protein
MTNYKRLCRQLTAELVRRETRLSERQMMLLRWEQIGEGKIILRQREVPISDIAYEAILSLPCHDNYVFGRSPYSPQVSEEMTLKERILASI